MSKRRLLEARVKTVTEVKRFKNSTIFRLEGSSEWYIMEGKVGVEEGYFVREPPILLYINAEKGYYSYRGEIFISEGGIDLRVKGVFVSELRVGRRKYTRNPYEHKPNLLH